ncbi:uroporphyrinogen decarboxylase family protein [Paludicola sp. MB14-C6]|uniref:uroporphyrinogen decarboxylase family protein n=1 Tax=Paludihabitans sp. MB14-C6 TaxID=3070656 RepID=UPI0027DDE5CB|nr:uroporphyrinogen decarboxylase family protein [Paludicola sp. MB14-C6]WMJ23537.1 uroporphyrinogen decarboxylase family protein [Paludicola sp. MB14-C6]
MTGYERIMAALKGEKPDRTPMMLHNFMAAANEKGYTLNEFRQDPKKIARAFVDAARKYKLDGILIDIDTCMEANAIGVPTDFPNDEPARVTSGIAGGVEKCMEAMDPQKLYSNERIKILLEAVSLIKNEVGDEILVRGNADQAPFSLAMLSYGMENFMADLLDEDMEEDILKLIDRAYDVHIEYHKMIKSAGADITSFGDSSCGPDLISRAMYNKYAFPYHKRMAADLKKENILTVCHICGNLDNILEDVVAAGFPAIEVDYKTNIERAHELMKGKCTMFGPIDPSGVFYFGTPDILEAQAKRILDIFKGEGLVIGAGCALPKGTPENNIFSFSNTVLAHGKYE